MDSRPTLRERWLIVTNRLPYTWDPKKKEFKSSSGGLISAVTAIKTETERIWVGAFSGDEGELARSGSSLPPIEGIHAVAPVWLPESLYSRYYNGIANSVLWPLFHYENIDTQFHDMDWDAYVSVNQMFAQEVVKQARPGDLIWVHDFHLCLLPRFIKELNPELKVGFFLHIPFPSSEIFRQLPVREELLRALLHSDLIGFHDFAYLRHFCSSLQAVLGITSSTLTVPFGNHEVRLGVFPVGIDTPYFQTKGASSEVEKKVEALRKRITTPNLFLGVDRLDYIKGIDLKLQAFSEFLTRYPEARGQVSLLQLCVPTRTEVRRYQKLRNQIEQMVGKINGTFGKPGYTPVNYMYNSLSTEELIALYRLAQVMLVTSKRDGMNLVALEYLASQNSSDPGCVLISEFAGAVSTLSDAFIINPWDISSVSQTMRQALDRPRAERIFAHNRMMEYLDKYTATQWAKSFMKSLKESEITQDRRLRGGSVPAVTGTKLSQAWLDKIQERPLSLLLDFDGTLVPLEPRPDTVVLPEATRDLLLKLSQQPDLDIVIVSGRPREFLEQQFKGLDVHLTAEHGAEFYDHVAGKWESLIRTDYHRWYETALNVVEDYYRRVPKSIVEKKTYGISFHYRMSPREFASYQAKKLTLDLEELLVNMPVSILQGHSVVEARAVDANKGTFVRWYVNRLPKKKNMFIAVGDDLTDEEMFEAMPRGSLSLRVGGAETRALHRLQDQSFVLSFLRQLLELRSSRGTLRNEQSFAQSPQLH